MKASVRRRLDERLAGLVDRNRRRQAVRRHWANRHRIHLDARCGLLKTPHEATTLFEQLGLLWQEHTSFGVVVLTPASGPRLYYKSESYWGCS